MTIREKQMLDTLYNKYYIKHKPVKKEGGMAEQKRYKRAVAIIDNIIVTCPFKVCGHQNSTIEGGTEGKRKGDIVECYNCHKKFKISKIL